MTKKIDETGGDPSNLEDGNEPFQTKTKVMTLEGDNSPARRKQPSGTQEPIDNEDGDKITLTKTELEKRVNDGRADIGRLLKAQAEETQSIRTMLETIRKESESLRQEREDILKEREESELSGVKDQPDIHDALKLKHQNRRESVRLADEKRKLDAEKAEHRADVEYARGVRAKEKAETLGKQYGVDSNLLYQVAGNEPGKMENIAKILPKLKGEEETEEEETEHKVTSVKGVRGANLGAKGSSRSTWTLKDYEEAYIRGEITRQKYEEVMRKAGKL